MKPMILVLAAAAVLLVVYVICGYNRFVKLRNRVRDQQAQIDVQTKRRCDLIPNLIETVKGCANFERSTLDAVVSARSSLLNGSSPAEKDAADAALTSALHHLIAVSEGYPDLKASANFASLQKELSETEDKIAKARQFYNDTVLKYNDAIEVFPASLVAKLTGFGKIEFLKAAESEREAVKVQF